MSALDDYLARGVARHGDKFDPSALADQFKPYFGTGKRIRVRFSYGEELTGTVGATTGWRPAFLLMRRSNSQGSPWLLGPDDKIVAVKRGRHYVDV